MHFSILKIDQFASLYTYYDVTSTRGSRSVYQFIVFNHMSLNVVKPYLTIKSHAEVTYMSYR